MKHTQPTTKKIETIVGEEMQRLARISPLLSPTVGWPKIKGLRSVVTKLDVTQVGKSGIGLPELRTPWCLDDSAEHRAEAERGMRALLDSVVDLATAALKPAGWKPKAIERQNSHHVAMLWTRKGREVALLVYMRNAAPGVSWFNTMGKWFKPSGMKGPNAYSDEAVLAIAAPRGGDESLREVCATLDKRILADLKAGTQSRKKRTGMVIEASAMHHGMSQVHICKMRKENVMAPQHQKLVESLVGKVCFVGFDKGVGRTLPEMEAQILKATPSFTLGAAEAWGEMSGKLEAGHVRLVAVDDQGRMKWCETFGPDETVPKATIKRLLADSRPWEPSQSIEQKAIYRSLKS